MLTRLAIETHQEVHRVEAPELGLVGFIAIHSTQAGPAAGGLRMRPYANQEAALQDVLRLSRGMTYKNAAADLPLGGGKAVIIGDPSTQKTPEVLQAFGRAVQSLGGRYWTAEDMGMSPDDMNILSGETQYVAGLAEGAFASGDPSPVTARGIFNALRIGCRHKFGDDNLHGQRVALQGLGHVGMYLAQYLHEQGALLTVCDPDHGLEQQAQNRFGAKIVGLDQIYDVQADIFAPCAIGGILNVDTIARLKVALIAGGANNQLATERDAAHLHDRGILYAPDYVANGGGIINVAAEILKIDDAGPWVAAKLAALGDTMDRILRTASKQNESPAEVADQVVLAAMNRAAA